MACDSWLAKLDTYLDGELSSSEMSAFDAHVRGCSSCAASTLARVQLKRAVRSAGQRFQAAPEFRQKIRAQVAAPSHPRRSLSWFWAAVTLALVLSAFVTGWITQERGRQAALYSELTDLHVATLASATPVDVISTDRHTVKPWFQGKIPFSFNLPDLANSEFTLIGGRVTYLRGTPGAQLIYQLRKHEISVFIFPEQALRLNTRPEALFTHLTFHTASWTQDGLRYFVLGDVSPDQLQSLAALLRAAK